MNQQHSVRVGVNAAIVRNNAILLVEFIDEQSGLHYNLPGGGLRLGETLHEALRREVREETCTEVEIERLLLVWEYVPSHYQGLYGPAQKLGLIFACALRQGSQPRLPAQPDPNQTGVRWVALDDLPQTPLLPRISEQLIAALHAQRQLDPFIARI